MSYKKQNFQDGDTLFAEQLNEMSQGIFESVSYTAQTLTEAQKAQARENLGISTDSGSGSYIIQGIIDLENEEVQFDSSYRFADLIEAFHQGKRVVLMLEDEGIGFIYECPMHKRSDGEEVYFSLTTDDYEMVYSIWTWSDTEVHCQKVRTPDVYILNGVVDLDNLGSAVIPGIECAECHKAIKEGKYVALRIRTSDDEEASYVYFTLDQDYSDTDGYIDFVWKNDFNVYTISINFNDELTVSHRSLLDDVANLVISRLPSAEGVSF